VPLIQDALVATSSAVAIATLVIAAIAGVGVGGIIVAVITTRQERERQLREGMLTAADEFLNAAASVLSQLRTLHPSARKVNLGLLGVLVRGSTSVASADQIEDSPELQAAELERADVSLDAAKDRLARVRLLFGPDSPAVEAGDAYLRVAAMASGRLKTYYALGQPELAEVVKRRQEGIRNVVETVNLAGDISIPIPLGGLLLPIPLGSITGAVSGAVGAFVDLGKARANTQQLAQEALDQADAEITSFTRHAWEALRKPSWKPHPRGPAPSPASQGVANDDAASSAASITRPPGAEGHPAAGA
jgi:hypothetical protein